MKCAVYSHIGPDGELLYVGKSVNPPERNKRHAGASPWWPEVKSIEVKWYRSTEDALLAEAISILRNKPTHNREVPLRLIAESMRPRVSTFRGADLAKYEANKSQRIAVSLTGREKADILSAMKREGITSIGGFVLLSALQMARQ